MQTNPHVVNPHARILNLEACTPNCIIRKPQRPETVSCGNFILQDLHIRDVTASLKVCTCSVLPAASSHRTSVHDPNIHLRSAQTRSLYARRSPAVHLHLITRCYSSMLAATRVNSRIYPHIPAHTSTYPRVLAHTRAHSRILAHTRAYPRIPAHTRAYQRISRVLAHTRAHSRILAHTRAYSRIPAHTSTYPRILAHTRAHSRMPAHTRAYPRIPAHTRAYQRISRVLAHTRAYSRIPAHTRAYPRIPAHTRAYPRIPAHTRAYPRIPGPPQAPCPQSRFPATVPTCAPTQRGGQPTCTASATGPKTKERTPRALLAPKKLITARRRQTPGLKGDTPRRLWRRKQPLW